MKQVRLTMTENRYHKKMTINLKAFAALMIFSYIYKGAIPVTSSCYHVNKLKRLMGKLLLSNKKFQYLYVQQ